MKRILGYGLLSIVLVFVALVFLRVHQDEQQPAAAADPNLEGYAKTCQIAKAMGSGVNVFDCIEQMKEGAAEAQRENHRSAEDCAWYQARLDDPLVDAVHKADYRRSMKKGGCKVKGGK